MATMSDSDVYRLIELVRDHPCIWDQRCQDYRNRDSAREAYIYIARSLNNGMTEQLIKAKFKSLRTHFAMKLQEYEKSKPSGSAADSVQEPTWRYFRSLLFLRPCVVSRKGRDNLLRNAHTGDEMDNLSQLTENTCSSMSQRTEYEYSDSQPQFSNSAAYVYNTPLALQIDEEEDEDNLEEASDINMLIRQTRASPPEIASNPVSRPLSTPPEHRTQPRPLSAPATLQQSPRLNSPSPKSLSTQPTPPRVRAPARESSAFQPQVPVPVRQTPPQPKKRKQEAAVDQAVSALQTLVKRRHDQPARQEQESSENDSFFQMLAKKVEKLPEDIQDTLRLEFHMKVVEETRKLRASCVAPPPASEDVHDV